MVFECRSPETDDSSHLSSKTFLMQGGSFYHHVLELMFGRLTKPLYQQVWFGHVIIFLPRMLSWLGAYGFFLLLFWSTDDVFYLQAVRKVGEFIHGQVLPGALAEIGFLCSAAVYANPAYAVPQLLEPLMNSVLSALADTPSTGYSGQGSQASSAEYKVSDVYFIFCWDFQSDLLIWCKTIAFQFSCLHFTYEND